MNALKAKVQGLKIKFQDLKAMLKLKFRFLNKLTLMGKTGLAILLLIILLALFGPLLSSNPHNVPSGDALEAPSLKPVSYTHL
ncbi:MAG TPA: hypothetical protein DCE02_02780, partial [Ruminiclostridium sp.]|nr:hypothetical protein [Ruminiclostridium sp.]